jgi:NAD(P)-dependent dehydrogenase (short-subunit alcohol dehydrogenase family)
MLTYFTYYLADELSGTGLTVNALHPGVVTTRMLKNGFNMTGEDVTVGAKTPVYLATSQEVEGLTGLYFDKKISFHHHAGPTIFLPEKKLSNGRKRP